MRDYGNMPKLALQEHGSVYRAKAQILREEPLILILPDDVSLDADLDDCGCRPDPAGAIVRDCSGGETLMRLAQHTELAELKILADAAAETSALVDVDMEANRLIIHD